jgi:hypothetical protein
MVAPHNGRNEERFRSSPTYIAEDARALGGAQVLLGPERKAPDEFVKKDKGCAR